MNNKVFLYKIPEFNIREQDTSNDPDTSYPEYRFDRLSKRNDIYSAIRQLFYLCGYDRGNYGGSDWNPLGDFIRPGQTVLIKPNMVLHCNHEKKADVYSVVTSPAIIRCVIDYVYIALKGKGRIIIGDAPLHTADFEKLRQILCLNKIQELYKTKKFDIEVTDFRLSYVTKDNKGVIQKKQKETSPVNYIRVNLGSSSMLSKYNDDYKKFRVTEYDPCEMKTHHNKDVHEYCVHRSVLEADVIISLPKIKTHRKAGYTCAMKNLVGINGNKDWLPHHRKGSIEEGGDEYLHKSLRKRLISKSWDLRWKSTNPLWQKTLYIFERALHTTRKVFPFKDNYFEGSWWGNDTISRTITDLNRVVIYCDKQGQMQETQQRKLLYLADGIICGEGEGPMKITPKQCDVLIWGHNSYAVDMLAVKLMGFDYKKINTLKNCLDISSYKIFEGNPEDIKIFGNLDEGIYRLSNIRDLIGFDFVAPASWSGHIELEGIDSKHKTKKRVCKSEVTV
jgi:uncharacterized protein (DUF362 family)